MPGHAKHATAIDRSGVFGDRSGVFHDRSGVFHDRSGVFDDRSGVFQFYTDAKLPLLWLDLKDIKKIKVQNKHIYGCGNRLF